MHNKRNTMDTDLIEAEVMQAATRLKSRNPDMGALVLECTDLPPYAAEIQKLLRIPVFDLTTLATMAHTVVTRMPYRGIMPW